MRLKQTGLAVAGWVLVIAGLFGALAAGMEAGPRWAVLGVVVCLVGGGLLGQSRRGSADD